MPISRHIRLIASAAAVALLAGAAQAQDKVRIGTEGAYPPFNNLNSAGQLEGFDIDIANALCEEMKVECEFITQDWDGIIPALQAGRFDAIIASMSITDVTKEGLAGKSIGAQGSTTHSNFAEATYTDSDVRLYPTADEYKLDIVNGRIDAVVDDIIVLQEWLATPDGACCKIAGTITPVEEIHGPGAGIAIRKGEDELREKFNAAIDAIRANGKYKEINDKYFSFDAYGS